jgi:anti-sigma regulatory factor (Ser/Thr protein kinase)
MRLTFETIEEVLSYVYVDGGRVLDLSAVRFVDPYALLILDLAVRHGRETGKPLQVQWPATPKIRRWMTQMRFFADIRVAAPPSDLPAADEALQPIVHIDREENVSHLVDSFEQRLARRYPIDEDPRRRFTRILFELFQNIPQHSNATGDILDPHGIAAMQDDEDAIHLAIADKGMGLRRSLGLRSGIGRLSDRDSIRSIVLDGLSRFEDPGRGQELQRIVRLVRKWEGAIAIRSGSALLYQSETGGDLFDVAPFPGVQIALRIPRFAFGIGEGVFGERGVESCDPSVFNE